MRVHDGKGSSRSAEFDGCFRAVGRGCPNSSALRPRTSVRLPLLLLLGFVFIAGSVYALDPAKEIAQYPVRNWQADDGLGESSVNAIVQPADGYLWLATQEGVARFDGVRFNLLNEKDAATPSRHNSVAALLVARDGSVWVGGSGGVARHKDGVTTLYGKEDGLTSEYVWSLAEGPDGSIWIATVAGGVNRFKDGKFTAYTTRDGLPSTRCGRP